MPQRSLWVESWTTRTRRWKSILASPRPVDVRSLPPAAQLRRRLVEDAIVVSPPAVPPAPSGETAPADHGAAAAKVHPASLLRRVIRETLSFSVIETVGQLFSWASNLLLARLLLPKDFGIYDICGSFILMGCLFGDGGLGAALVRKPTEPSQEDYESVFVSTVTVGSVLAIGFSIAAPFLARAYHLEGIAVWVLIAMAPGYLLGSLRTYPMVRLERDLRFSTIARIDLAVLFFRQ